MQPEISVILPLYNAESYIREAIDSLLIQTFTNFELIIINDGSTDNSFEIIKEIRSKAKSKMVRYKAVYKETSIKCPTITPIIRHKVSLIMLKLSSLILM